MNDAKHFWEGRYAANHSVWSGQPNAALVDAVEKLPAGSSLDLGSGEGADALWLARRGWNATGLDISPTAVERATKHAEEVREEITRAGGSAQFEVADLATWSATETYDLLTVSYLHTTVDIPRERILNEAVKAVAPGGYLFILSHIHFPPWSKARGHIPLTAEEEIDALNLSPTWETVLAETRSRTATGPEGEHATLEDAVVLLRRQQAR